MIEITISNADGRPLRARVELGDSQIVLHSRSGTNTAGRNPDYRGALETILTRLEREGIKPDVFLDSAPARQKPLSDRQLARPSDLIGEISEQFYFLIRQSNAGSASHGAWRRLLLRIPRMPDYALTAIIDGSARSRQFIIDTKQLERVERRHLDVAISELRSGAERPTRFEDATGYLLLPPDGGPPLPPKKVFGIALAEALQTYVTPQDFSSGEGIFRIIRDRGLEVVPFANVSAVRKPHSSPSQEEVEDAIAGMPLTDEERRWIEGDISVATHLRRERSGSLPRWFKTDFRSTHGRLFCQRCGHDYVAEYGAPIAEACFEAHHITPVAQMEPGHETTPDQLQLLCANCHRAVHREMALA